jgi:glycosidase
VYISRRPRLGKSRLGEPDLIFSYPWPEVAENLHMYLVSEFTSYFPGRVELLRRGDRGIATVPVREGKYHYAFVDSLYRVYQDYENPAREVVDLGLNIGKISVSVADAGLSELREALSEGGLHGELILHDERWPGYFSGYGGATVVRLFTLRGEVDEVSVITRANSSWRTFRAARMMRDEYRDYYEARVPDRVTAYYFVLGVDGKNVPFGIDGLGSQEPWVPGRGYINDTPWYLGTSYYLVFPDSFAGYSKEYASATSRPRTSIGGNLRALAERLDYIADLGVEAIYLTPVYVSNSYHHYDVIDQRHVDESLGGDEALEKLITKAHSLGLRIIMDVVVHHTSPCAKEFRDVLASWKSSAYWGWYRILVDSPIEVAQDLEALKRYTESGCKNFPEQLRGKKPFYETFAGLWGMPKLNVRSSEVLDNLCDIMRGLTLRGVDGFRIDVAHGLPDSSMTTLYECIAKDSDVPVIMEIMGELSSFPMGVVANSAMNYEARGPIIRFFKGEITAAELSEALNRQYLRLPLYVANALYNLLGSHDTPRILDVLGSSELVIRAFVLLSLLYGSPSIYYGDEIGLRGGKDPDNRLPMPWDEGAWDKGLRSLMRDLLSIRRRVAALRYGFFRSEPLGADAIAVERGYQGDEVVGYITRGPVSMGNIKCGEILLGRGFNDKVLDGFLICKS